MYILFDIGGTKTRISRSDDGRAFETPVKIDTPQDYREGIERIREVVGSLRRGEEVTAFAGGIAGPLSPDKDHLVSAPNLLDWKDRPILDDLSSVTGAMGFLENDTSVVALGEAHAGAGRGFDILAYLTVSTGVGGARIVKGNIDAAHFGFEPGHQIMDIKGDMVAGTPSKLEAEDLLSGTAIEKKFGLKPYEIHDVALWEELSAWLACLLVNTTVYWSPHAIVLGGSMIVGDPAISVDRTRDHFSRLMSIFPVPPVILKAQLRDTGGLYGALELIRQRFVP
jgi:predicted NBD/HSP70 family sugar kinase